MLPTTGFPRWIEKAVASGEPQRIIPMASVVLPRAALAGDRPTVRSITETVLEVVGDRLQWAPLASAAIPRAAFTLGEHDLLRRVDDALTHKAETAPYARAVSVTCRGLRALAEGRAAEASVLLQEVVALEQERSAWYNAACAELDLARAHDETGDQAEPSRCAGEPRTSSTGSDASTRSDRRTIVARTGILPG